ncbi:hypothetical protein MUN77_05515 [Leucobacter allii]|uniref:helix-turn-helix domain-containing protein n=1 Tax=Leucobacter allii TaxID=2932247 RepID=UPI001FD403E4|nr:hypothetical protein [Leucobacter allii]UOR02769.1 hypothetical protein MUN77_05515 [Leucobacter allii]
MQELAGRLSALSPEAGESLKVIAYFDALVADGAGLEAVVRAAAVLGGAPAAAILPGRRIRVDADGVRSRDAADTAGPPDWPELRAGGAAVRLERSGEPQPHDELILERFLLAVSALDARSHPEATALEILLDGARSEAERATAAARLRLSSGAPVAVWALRAEDAEPGTGRGAVLVDRLGPLRARLADPAAPAPGEPAGAAVAPHPGALPDAWRDARIALRLADRRRPVVRAEDLGVLIELARSEASRIRAHPDVAALSALDARTLELLDALVRAPSVRAAAEELGVHHSSLQQRHASLVRQLGYDPRAADGRLRFEAARMMGRLSD